MTGEIHPVPAEWAREARYDAAGYEQLYGRSIADPGSFWLDQAKRLDWVKRPELAGDWSFDEDDFRIEWFADGKLNVAANCIDRHLASRGDEVAIIWEPDDPAEASRQFTYRELHEEVCRFANVLRGQGVKKGDRVTIYMPMIPEAAFAILACARLGAIHSVVFGGFSPEALAGRITDCDSSVVITADEGRRGGKRIALKANVDAAAERAQALEKVIVVKATGGHVTMTRAAMSGITRLRRAWVPTVRRRR
ncbi:AMP-binding enzyme domain-containing protein [Ditylenchus destructor]|uniref:acetate--CoA ligase n=1 Tax=Ditylenchus destructor TaxID=166010 RepID=A0AAD4MGX4_9BILA|nr:AMP-binding enzyme domain-containing protein [Ditylenchus destructor]